MNPEVPVVSYKQETTGEESANGRGSGAGVIIAGAPQAILMRKTPLKQATKNTLNNLNDAWRCHQNRNNKDGSSVEPRVLIECHCYLLSSFVI
jgi:hypothetical protein